MSSPVTVVVCVVASVVASSLGTAVVINSTETEPEISARDDAATLALDSTLASLEKELARLRTSRRAPATAAPGGGTRLALPDRFMEVQESILERLTELTRVPVDESVLPAEVASSGSVVESPREHWAEGKEATSALILSDYSTARRIFGRPKEMHANQSSIIWAYPWGELWFSDRMLWLVNYK